MTNKADGPMLFIEQTSLSRSMIGESRQNIRRSCEPYKTYPGTINYRLPEMSASEINNLQ